MCGVALSSAAASETTRRATAGVLPSWSRITPSRAEHAGRVAALLGEWADALALPPAEAERWRAAGWLHDALRDAPSELLRAELGAAAAGLPDPLLHGPAAAHRLAGEVDPELATAIRYHTVGHPSLGALGTALYLADFLEPGRSFLPEWRAALRSRMPGAVDDVLREVLRARVVRLLELNRPVRPETVAFWNRVAQEES